jgi:hypothetical protein
VNEADWKVTLLLNEWCTDVRENWPLRSKPTIKLLAEIKELYGKD